METHLATDLVDSAGNPETPVWEAPPQRNKLSSTKAGGVAVGLTKTLPQQAASRRQAPQEVLSDCATRVQQALRLHGMETPLVHDNLSSQKKRAVIEDCFTTIMNTLGLDLNDDSLAETPKRIAKMYTEEIFSGLDYSRFPKVSIFENKMQTDEMIKVSDISLTSTCEHHFVTIDGSATVAYIPKEKIIGLSKINRVVRFFAQRPQVQERLNQQILIALQTLLETDDVAVTINAIHYCVKARGVMDESSRTTTTSLGGAFKNDSRTRNEFFTS